MNLTKILSIGMCHVPPIVRSQQWKLIRCAYKARCPACWLKMCLRSFQMPTNLKNSLASMLPENMRLAVTQAQTSDTYPSELNTSGTRLGVASRLGHWQPETQLQSTQLVTICSPFKVDVSKADINCNKKKKRRKSRLKIRKTVVKTNQLDILKRQKLDLKGPRVKHVCRSASIVLGKPLATFASEITDIVPKNDTAEENIISAQSSDTYCRNGRTTEPCTSCDAQEHLKETDIDETVNNARHKEIQTQTNPASVLTQSITTNILNNKNENEPVEKCSETTKQLIVLSNNYRECRAELDFEGGYELLGAEPFPLNAICYLCGSAGKEPMIHCASCCEPYHTFCLGDSVLPHLNSLHTSTNFYPTTNPYWRFNWTCYKCTSCSSCGESDPKRSLCQKCFKYYHYECTNPKWNKLLICYNCACCRMCGSQDISKVMCNITLCTPCFKLRKKQNCCPYCQESCNDNEFDTKMMECSECKFLVHTKCENVSDEKYEMFKNLPQFVTYVCRNCTVNTNNSNWEEVLQMELKYNFHSVLRTLSRNRLVRKLLKWGRIRNHTYSNSSLTTNYYMEEEKKCLQPSKTPGKLKSSPENPDISSECNLKNMRSKLFTRECSVDLQNIDMLKSNDKMCETISDQTDTLSFIIIKNKINSGCYKTIKDFHKDVDKVLRISELEELKEEVNELLKNVFPWYECTEINTRIAIDCNDIDVEDNSVLIHLDYDRLEPASVVDTNALGTITVNTATSGRCLYGEDDDNTYMVDNRKCVLCGGQGDRASTAEGRLLYYSFDRWIHVHCSFWSTDAYEHIDGSIRNMYTVITKSQTVECVICNQPGASLYCCFKSCSNSYHFMCARNDSCIFFHDNKFYCSLHYDRKQLQRLVVRNDRDFEVSRPVFIEMDMKEKSLAEVNKVRYLLGSLAVTNLGVFCPSVSDTEEAIITSDFICTRLFWSTVEPWKIVQYTISTCVVLPEWQTENERNFTVDYSQNPEIIEKQLKEIEVWKKEVRCGKISAIPHLNNIGIDESASSRPDVTPVEECIVSQLLEYMIDLVCNREMEECATISKTISTECPSTTIQQINVPSTPVTADYTPEESDEPQNTADLLPPELKDAIFEDLPHDLLDGISMQDIFPKLMSYEDVIVDLKNTELQESADFLKDGKNELGSDINLDSDEFLQFRCKRNDLFAADSDMWLEPKMTVPEDFTQNNKVSNPKCSYNSELKRSKSEVFSGIKKLTRSRNHQRSCSLTWSCKLDNTLTNNIKKRKVSCASKNSSDIGNNLFMVVDGTMTVDSGKTSMLQELRLPEGVLMTVGRTSNADCVTELKYRLEDNSLPAEKLKAGGSASLEVGKENKCRVWQKRTGPRLLQVDGAADMSSSDSETGEFETELGAIEEPVKCARCQCTYRTHSSYKRHLLTCDFISTSESESENSPEVAETATAVTSVSTSSIGAAAQTNISPEEGKTTSKDTATPFNIMVVPVSGQTQSSLQTELLTTENNLKRDVARSANNILLTSNQDHKSCKNTELTNFHLLSENSDVFQINNQQIQMANEIVQVCDTNTRMSVPLPVSVLPTQNTPVHVNKPTYPVDTTNKIQTLQLIQKSNRNPQKSSILRRTINTRGRGRPARTNAVRRIRNENPIHILSQSKTNRVLHLPQHCASSGPTIIIQHVPSNGLQSMPTYIDAYQQHSSHNLQCIVNTHLLPTVTSVPTMYQLQTESTNIAAVPIVGASPATAGIIPGLQLGQQVLIQQQQPPHPAPTRTHSLQCSMVAGDQVVLATPTATLDAALVTEAPHASPLTTGGMFLTTAAAQPVYYGFETIVQNTVMQSQQFLSTSSLPGPTALLSNSSYSATTTQVFQASKIEPVIDMNNAAAAAATAGYIIVNPATTIINPQLPTVTVTSAHPQTAPNTQNTLFNVVQNRGTPAAAALFQHQPIAEPHTIIPIQPAPILTEPTLSIQTVDAAQKFIENDRSSVQPMTFLQQPQVPQPTALKAQAQIETAQSASIISESITDVPADITMKSVSPTAMLTRLVPQQNCGQTASITLPVAPYGGNDNNHSVPMNIVTPIPQAPQPVAPTVPLRPNSPAHVLSTPPAPPVQPPIPSTRPMNRVLPMQTSTPKDIQKTKLPSPHSKLLSIEPPDILNRLSETVDKIQETLNNESDTMLSSKTNVNESQLLKLESASLKLVFQKQSQDGIYKISNKYVSKSNVPLKKISPKATKSKTVEAVKPMRNIDFPKLQDTTNSFEQEREREQEEELFSQNKSHMLYKISSADGYERSSTSLTELWEKVFEAVQKARAAHNMPPLPQHAFDMISGLQLIGLKNNGLRYMMEQLPGAARCNKYKRTFHKDTQLPEPLTMIDIESEELSSDLSQGAIRCMPIARCDQNQPYDMFSWLASRHRKPDYSIQIESDLSSR